ncbi:hypothetical protein CHR53_03255 [Neobacillus mesonae]|uniref:Uncharacterized protein n=1 Tax=Neobacillus mesonae TaxID=1193713 RepID=A0A3T0HTI1_9BACI|nr:hypothetical protein CHR53_03255 [Neobacillus mesonae]
MPKYILPSYQTPLIPNRTKAPNTQYQSMNKKLPLLQITQIKTYQKMCPLQTYKCPRVVPDTIFQQKPKKTEGAPSVVVPSVFLVFLYLFSGYFLF